MGLALIAHLVWRLFFGAEDSFEVEGAVIGCVGFTSIWLRNASVRTSLVIPMCIYLALVVLSTIANLGRFEPPPRVSAWQPAISTAAAIAYCFGLLALLRTNRRLGLLITGVVAAISVIGFQVVHDYVTFSVGDRRMAIYPSVLQWSGYPQLGLLFAIALSMVLALGMFGSGLVLVATLVVAAALLLDLVVINSRSAYVTVAVTYLVVAFAELRRVRRARLFALAALVMVGIGSYLTTNGPGASDARTWWANRLYRNYVDSSGRREDAGTVFGRLQPWTQAALLIRHNPLLGVGPAKYSSALRSEYIGKVTSDDMHAHNVPLHIAAETGIPGAIAFLGIWFVAIRGVVRVDLRGGNGMVAVAIGGGLLAFCARSMSDPFGASTLAASHRSDFLMWTFVAAAVAVAGLPTRHDECAR